MPVLVQYRTQILSRWAVVCAAAIIVGFAGVLYGYNGRHIEPRTLFVPFMVMYVYVLCVSSYVGMHLMPRFSKYIIALAVVVVILCGDITGQ